MICVRPSCRELAMPRRNLCARHVRERIARERERKVRLDGRRPSPALRGYGPRWRAARMRFLQEHQQCSACGARAVVVDHVVPHRGDPVLFWDRSNWQALCLRCHNAKTAREVAGRRAVGRGA